VKNLPKNISEAKLREHFQKSGGQVTDVKLILTERGKSRQFAFVGYATPAEASAALQHFNRSFLGTNRLVIQFAYPKGDSHIPRAWSKHSEGSSRYAQEQEAKGNVNPKKRPSTDIAPAKDDVTSAEMTEAKKRKLEEFLGVNKKGKLWANADASGPGDSMITKEKADKKKTKKDTEKDIKKLLKEQDSDSDSDEDEYQDSIKPHEVLFRPAKHSALYF
jgi:multiple RNA-binding domain-containing protein 1